MLYMDVSTWEPTLSDKVIEHFKELKPPAGINIIITVG
ncbi:hypothetical protein B0H22_10373 [Methanohalophilus euhalobius]|uniref:Uncharacterized protein n=1 Tax=Methanohalophilus euhalobius TaxID=51203 RepID=A0A314ZY54_9EURY|nr:hypothetical protein B0H22_10373 [Methanohalophilus euhalobius]